MLERSIVVTNSLGLHARAAARLVRAAGTFSSLITLKRIDNGYEANAKSILSVLHIAAGKGVELMISADGEDQEQAIAAILDLFTSNFGEN